MGPVRAVLVTCVVAHARDVPAGDFAHHPKGQVHDFMEYSEDIEIFELASPAHHHSIDV